MRVDEGKNVVKEEGTNLGTDEIRNIGIDKNANLDKEEGTIVQVDSNLGQNNATYFSNNKKCARETALTEKFAALFTEEKALAIYNNRIKCTFRRQLVDKNDSINATTSTTNIQS